MTIQEKTKLNMKIFGKPEKFIMPKQLDKEYKNEWKPMFKGFNAVASPNIGASKKQIWKIWFKLDEMGFEPMTIIFKLNNRADGITREMTLNELDKGSAWDIQQAIRKHKIKDLIK
jgi:hypothetical protein